MLGLVGFLPADAAGQDHAAHHASPGGRPTESGQAAFAAIREIVGLLEADSGTDWSRVDLEALRQHLITMDRVLLHSRVTATPVPGGIQLDVTGTGEVVTAIREMLTAHAPVLDRDPSLRSGAAPLADGIRLTVTAEDPADARTAARIRGLGFAGLLVTDDHHAVHHLAIARGEAGAHRH
jgi:hypothetical protein